MLALSISYGIYYLPTDDLKIICMKNDLYAFEAVKRRPWWIIKDDDEACLIWKSKTNVT